MSEIKYLSEKIQKNAQEKGFWDAQDTILKKMENHKQYGDSLDFMFTEDEITQVHKAFKMQKLMLMVSELGEACESDRKSNYADIDFFDKDVEYGLKKGKITGEDLMVQCFEDNIKDTFEDEISDTVIRIFDFCEKEGIDLEYFINLKMKYNETRERLHGKEY